MQVTIAFRFSVRCPRCSVVGPVPGLRRRNTCLECGAHHDLERDVGEAREGGLAYAFGAYHDVLAEAALLREGGAGFRDAVGHNYQMRMERGAPACTACGAALPAVPDGATELRCGCGNRVAVRWPDDETRIYDPRLRCVINDGSGHGPSVKEIAASGVVIGCAKCGAAVAISDKKDRRRLRTCQYCSAENYLPDAAWLALFPEPEHHCCYLVYHLDARTLAGLYRRVLSKSGRFWLEDEDEARLEREAPAVLAAAHDAVLAAALAGTATAAELEALAVDPTLPESHATIVDAALDPERRSELRATIAPVIARQWVRSSDVELREAAARHAAIGAAELATLAGDPDPKIRVLVAERPETPADTLAILRKDADQDVVRAVKANPSYKPGFFEKIFG